MTDEPFLIEGRCRSCRYAQRVEVWRVVAGIPERYPLFCGKAEMRSGEPEDPQTMAFSMDHSTYAASLIVTPHFGCIMYEPKDDASALKKAIEDCSPS